MSVDRLYMGPLYVKKSPVHGYGVFAAKDLAAHEIIEECHTLRYEKKNDPLINHSFHWQGNIALPLGFGCIYNHSSTPNVTFTNDLDRGVIVFKTLVPVRQGEELFSSYGKHWFDHRDLTMHSKRWWRPLYYRGGRSLLRATLVIVGIFACTQALRYFAF